jgi:membrane protein DedA with SNARE-associated domain
MAENPKGTLTPKQWAACGAVGMALALGISGIDQHWSVMAVVIYASGGGLIGAWIGYTFGQRFEKGRLRRIERERSRNNSR